MLLDLLINAALYGLGLLIFGHFEPRAPVMQRVIKLAFLLGVTALLSATVGRPWPLVGVGGLLGLGVVVHFWWALSHGIHPLTAEPRAKYYALRGWELPTE